MLMIEKLAEGETTVLRLMGRINPQQLDELSTLIADAKSSVKLDLAEVTLVDVDAIRFLGHQAAFKSLTVRASSESGSRESKRQTQRRQPKRS